MRKATFAGLVFVVCGYAANAQFTLTPKAGIEQSFTSVGYNNQSKFSPLGSVVSPQFSVRLDYRFKNIHGPFVGLATSRSVVGYEFTNPETGYTDFMASKGDMQLRLEAGYMYNSPAIKLGKAKTVPAKSVAPAATQKRCGGYTYTSRCGQYKQAKQAAQMAAAKKVEPLNMRIQPFAGMAFVPNSLNSLSTNTAMYKYNAGNWNSAFIAGTNFEVGKGTQKKFVVGVQYLRGIGNLEKESMTTVREGKGTVTELQSTASAWNITVGVPFTFGKKKTEVKQAAVAAPAAPAAPAQEAKKAEEKKPEEKKKSCSQYRTRCGNWQ